MAENAVPKIEGHATFYAHLKAGRVDQARIIGLENDRFVEKILFGRKYYEAPIITSRICGICPTIHNVTSTKGIEAACGINPSDQTKKLRELMLLGQMIQSHSLHLYLLVLPDFVGAGSSFELQKSHPKIFENAISLKRYADTIIEIVGGRAVHPISNVPGGFKSFPQMDKLKNILKDYGNITAIAEQTVRMFHSFSYPKIKSDYIFSGLSEQNKYSIYEGTVKNSAGASFDARNYKRYITEELRPYTRAKFATFKGKEMMVGAMARININRKKLSKETHNLMLELGVKHFLENPFDNILAQAIENYNFIVESKKLIDYFIKNGIDKKDPVKPPRKFSTGVGASEAPRGTLFHFYEINKDGYITSCDLVTPTVQNMPALESDMKKLGPVIKDMKKDEADQTIELLIRAYDPCITCATH